MAKLTREQREEYERALAEDNEDDGEDQVTVTRSDGSSFTGTYRRAKALGLVSEPAPKKDDGDSAANDDKVKRFQSGRRVS